MRNSRGYSDLSRDVSIVDPDWLKEVAPTSAGKSSVR